jgi:hypothetical protein
MKGNEMGRAMQANTHGGGIAHKGRNLGKRRDLAVNERIIIL